MVVLKLVHTESLGEPCGTYISAWPSDVMLLAGVPRETSNVN